MRLRIQRAEFPAPSAFLALGTKMFEADDTGT